MREASRSLSLRNSSCLACISRDCESSVMDDVLACHSSSCSRSAMRVFNRSRSSFRSLLTFSNSLCVSTIRSALLLAASAICSSSRDMSPSSSAMRATKTFRSSSSLFLILSSCLRTRLASSVLATTTRFSSISSFSNSAILRSNEATCPTNSCRSLALASVLYRSSFALRSKSLSSSAMREFNPLSVAAYSPSFRFISSRRR